MAVPPPLPLLQQLVAFADRCTCDAALYLHTAAALNLRKPSPYTTGCGAALCQIRTTDMVYRADESDGVGSHLNRSIPLILVNPLTLHVTLIHHISARTAARMPFRNKGKPANRGISCWIGDES